MIESRSAVEPSTTTGTRPAKITTSMIIADLENGIDRNGIKAKYDLEAWEVKQMFMHPTLKNKKAKKVRKLSFEFVDDTLPNAEPMADAGDENDANPNQVTLEQAIEESEAAIEDAKTSIFNGMVTQQAIVDILSPSEEEEGEDVITESKPEWIEDKIATQQAEEFGEDFDNESDEFEY